MKCDYGWIITKDYISEKCGDKSTVGVCGPREMSNEVLSRLKNGEGIKFRLYDDDGELYLEGLQIEGDSGEEGSFAPLDNFGEGWGGCTELKQYLDGKWQTV